MSMTLEQLEAKVIAWLGDVAANGSLSGAAVQDIREAFAQLFQPAQAVDVAGYFVETRNGEFEQVCEQYKADADVFPLYRTRTLGAAQEGWRDIASAPKDGARVLVCGGTYDVGWDTGFKLNRPVIAFWDRDHWHGPEANAHDEWHTCFPALWMPLPTPPTDGEG